MCIAISVILKDKTGAYSEKTIGEARHRQNCREEGWTQPLAPAAERQAAPVRGYGSHASTGPRPPTRPGSTTPPRRLRPTARPSVTASSSTQTTVQVDVDLTVQDEDGDSGIIIIINRVLFFVYSINTKQLLR